jgi:hypothetical protein
MMNTMPLAHIGTNIYHYGLQNQNRLLVDCLKPLLATMGGQGIPVRFWFNRADLRGPHIFALLTVPPAFADEVRLLLTQALADYLAQHSSAGAMSPEQVQAFHEACRGKFLNETDHLPGMAPVDSFSVFDHPEDGYPFRLGGKLPNSEELWEIFNHIVWEILEELSSSRASTSQAIRRTAQVDLELQRLLGDSFDYWLYHASTLYFSIDQLRRTENFPEALSRVIGVKNKEIFSRIWCEAEEGSPSPRLGRLVEIAVTPTTPPIRRWALLRELVHCSLKQLAVPVNLHLPLVFFALYRRSLQRQGGQDNILA